MSQAIALQTLPCARCGYDLRTLPDHSNCPECGLIIAESASVRPLFPWFLRFRRGVTFLLPGILLAINYVHWWLYLRFRDFDANPEGAVFLTHALLFLPAIWFMTTPDPFVARGPGYRRWLIALTIAQIIFACCALFLSRDPWPFTYNVGSGILLSAYALMPLVYVTELWLLLELLYRSLPMFTFRFPAWLFRPVQWTFIYSILSPAILYALINFLRIEEDPPVRLDPSTRRSLAEFLVTPALYLQLPLSIVLLLMVVYIRYRFRSHAALLRMPRVDSP
jgi:hypothetical protein